MQQALDCAPYRTGLPVLFQPRPQRRRSDLPVALVVAFAGAFLGCLATLHLSALGLSPALASAAVTVVLCAGLVVASPDNLAATTFSSSVYGGSFSGMTPIAQLSESVARTGLPQEGSLYLLSISCGLLFCIFTAIETRRRVVLLQGYGGRLGLLAAIGSLLFVTLGPWLAGQGGSLRLGHLNQFDQELGGSLAILAACLAGTFLTMVMQRLPHVADAGRAARTFVSATLAFAGMATMQAVWPNERCLVDAFYAGCFLGMSSPQRLSGRLQPVVAALALTVVLVQASTVLPLVGGSLGLAAFIAVAGVDLAWRTGGAMSVPPSTKLALGRSLAVAVTAAGFLLPSHVFHGLADETAGVVLYEPDPADTPSAAVQPERQIVDAVPDAGSPAPVGPAVDLDPAPAAVTKAEVIAIDAAPLAVAAPAVGEAPAPPVRAEQTRTRRTSRTVPGYSLPPRADSGPWGIIRSGDPGRTGAADARPVRAKPAAVRAVVLTSAAPRPVTRAPRQNAPKKPAQAAATVAPE
ncbi:hypothetical protein [Bradyrhizobium sp. SZCCHNR1015]|uniref:hypothetical protein n=1 Tax=Bradyrhizobium sp. SZCCHNR1015 TaxID=3057338 RepID=UPI002915DFBF|nr:hypothetical protein [Bradyrhizobium sp. SZCCHNR1015]